MSQMILPGVYIKEHAEGLIAPGQITTGNIGVVGTAAKGALLTPILVGSFQDAVQEFYNYDPWLDDSGVVNPNALTLVRALEQAFAYGATVVYAVRVSKTDAQSQPAAKAASISLKAGGGLGVTLQAIQPGTWGNNLSVKVEIQRGVKPFIDAEMVPISGPQQFKLRRPIDLTSARNKVMVSNGTVVRNLTVVSRAPKPGNDEVQIDASGKLIFPGGEQPKAPAALSVAYMVKADALQVTINLDRASEVYIVADGDDLAAQVGNELTPPEVSRSSWVNGAPEANQFQPLSEVLTPVLFKGGDDAAASANYQAGLDALLNSDVQIVLAAGQDQNFGNALQRHCDLASSDAIKRERIAVVGSGLIDSGRAVPPKQSNVDTFFDKVVGHNLASDRVIFVTPGLQTIDTPTQTEVTLPGSYAAAAVAGLISTFDPEVSPTNKVLAVDALEYAFDAAHLTELVQARVLALESRSGFRIVKGITTDTSGAFSQISIRRIVDYAKRGVRSAAEPYIGLLNDERVRAAMHATINSFLAEMLNDEMLESYDLDVSATRDEEIQGIARVTMSLQPVFSIDFIVVDMFLG